MSFMDMIKKSVLEQFESVTVGQMALSVGVAFLMGIFILLVYRQTFRGVLYSKGFAFSLVLLAMVTALVIRTISSNLALSLGMVGALSIVRFRTAIKEPVEIVFLFWSLAVGIVIGAGMIPLAIIGSALIGVILLLFANRKIRKQPYILVMSCKDEVAEQRITEILAKAVEYYTVKSKTVNAAGIEFTAELRTKNAETAFVNRITELEGVENATLVSYNGEYMG